MNKHTPGPWALKHVSGSNFAVQRFEIRGMFGSKPGILPVFNKDTTAIDGTTICCSPQDAALITAAPDLLDAAEKVIQMNRQHAEDQYGDANKAESWACVVVLRAAIAKARGEV